MGNLDGCNQSIQEEQEFNNDNQTIQVTDDLSEKLFEMKNLLNNSLLFNDRIYYYLSSFKELYKRKFYSFNEFYKLQNVNINDELKYNYESIYDILVILKKEIITSSLFLRLIIKMKSVGESLNHNLLCDLKYVMDKLPDYNQKLKKRLYGLKIHQAIPETPFKLLDLNPDKLIYCFYIVSFIYDDSNYHINKCIENSEKIEDNIIRSKKLFDSIMNDLKIAPVVKFSLNDEYSIRLYKILKHRVYMNGYLYLECRLGREELVRLVSLAVDEVIQEIGVESTQLNNNEDSDYISSKYKFFYNLKEEVKARIRESDQYITLQTQINDTHSRLKLLSGDTKEANQLNANLSQAKLSAKSNLNMVILDEFLRFKYSLIDYHNCSFPYREYFDPIYFSDYVVQSFACVIDNLFRVLHKFPDFNGKDIVTIPKRFVYFHCFICHSSCPFGNHSCSPPFKNYPPKKYKRDVGKCEYPYYDYYFEKYPFSLKDYKVYNGRLEPTDKRSVDYFSYSELVSTLNDILKEMRKHVGTILYNQNLLNEVMSKKLPKSSPFTSSNILNLDLLLKKIYKRKFELIVTPLNNIHRLIYLTVEMSRLYGIKLN